MRFSLATALSLIAFTAYAQAQTVIEDLPSVIIESPEPAVEKAPIEPYMPTPPVIAERPAAAAPIVQAVPQAPPAPAPIVQAAVATTAPIPAATAASMPVTAAPAPTATTATTGPIPASMPAPEKPAEISAIISDPFTVTDINVDITADTAAHARDKALEEAQRKGYVQLLTKLGTTDSGNLSADELAGLVRSFEVQSEHLSPVRYVGVFTVSFKEAAVRNRVIVPPPQAQPQSHTLQLPASMQAPVAPSEPPPAHLSVTIRAESLPAWVQIKKRLSEVMPITNIDMLGIGRGLVHIDLTYTGLLDDLKEAVAAQNFLLGQMPAGTYELYDGSLSTR
ncbi:MAG: hypothetical protein PHE27_09125 [Alphaproteobacteria bacterium]|nr:hypothetical protein [Alphaproteobacteria bacterium]